VAPFIRHPSLGIGHTALAIQSIELLGIMNEKIDGDILYSTALCGAIEREIEAGLGIPRSISHQPSPSASEK
jgi:hypothetical protein